MLDIPIPQAVVEEGGANITPMRYTGRIIAMTAIALILIALALSLPWYKSETVRSYNWLGETRTSVITTECYIDYYVSSSEGIRQYTDFYEEISAIMSLEKQLIHVWLIMGMLFLGAVLVDSRVLSVMLGWITLFACVFAIVQFAGRIRGKVLPSSTYNTTSVGDIGYIVAIAAVALTVAAAVARTVVLYQETKGASRREEAPGDRAEAPPTAPL